MSKTLVIGNGWPNKVAGHRFVWPLLIAYGGWGVIPCGHSEKEIPFVLRFRRFELRVLFSGFAGTPRGSSMHIQWVRYLSSKEIRQIHRSGGDDRDVFVAERETQREISICWRWDMTVKCWVRGF